jgi:hypothetical protein
MGRMVDVDDLASARIIAERLGFSGVHLVHYYFRSDDTFPEPVYVVPDMARPLRLWCWPEVEAWWANRHHRQARRPAAGAEKESEGSFQ